MPTTAQDTITIDSQTLTQSQWAEGLLTLFEAHGQSIDLSTEPGRRQAAELVAEFLGQVKDWGRRG